MTYWKGDGRKLKTMIYFVAILDTIHQAILSAAVYGYLVTNYGDVEYLSRLSWGSIIPSSADSGNIRFMVYRIYVLCHNPVLVDILVGTIQTRAVIYSKHGLFWGASVVACFAFIAISMLSTTWVELEAFRNIIVAMNALGATNDVVIAAVFPYFLHVSKTGFASTSHMINRIIVMSINTGIITALFSIAALISIVVRGNALIYAIFWLVAGRVLRQFGGHPIKWTFFLAFSLNVRNFLRRPGPGTADYPSFTASGGTRTGTTSDTAVSSRNARMLAIRMDISTEQNVEDDIPLDVSARLD
ncbi:hypothetical protein FISHEDRAFT_54906 [Fistulina hepatica ATCC 64428]|uniref:DUF6534 domain-containing protein n=1 Tax=Fistulina hepatica ATCC 64428 TaxID=1128425 RepID=A0A0D7AQU5_9AGAR|nr:hypothetical protein FISHEDRAFT_54906 [Fistulina hepatica ATCC 64428]